MFRSHPPVLRPAGWTFPQLLSLLTSSTELSYLPPNCFPPSHFPIARCRDTTLLLCAGRSGSLFTTFLPAHRLQSCPTHPHPHPPPAHHPRRSALPPPPCPRVCKCSSGLTLPLLDHCPSLLPSLLASSLPPTLPELPGRWRSQEVTANRKLWPSFSQHQRLEWCTVGKLVVERGHAAGQEARTGMAESWPF